MIKDIPGKRIIIETKETPEDLAAIENKTWQIHLLPNGKISLHPVVINPVVITRQVVRCPVILGGEQCGCDAGHEGKHMWGRGD